MHVTATCGTQNVEFVKSLGADEVLDYKTPRPRLIHGKEINSLIFPMNDLIFIACKAIWPLGVIKKGFGSKKLTFSKNKLVPFLASPKAENLEYLVNLVEEGKLKMVIHLKHPLSKAEDAWARSIEGQAT
ncbi:hypothetical protein LguiA_020665 [Lonicera macranthoides]